MIVLTRQNRDEGTNKYAPIIKIKKYPNTDLKGTFIIKTYVINSSINGEYKLNVNYTNNVDLSILYCYRNSNYFNVYMYSDDDYIYVVLQAQLNYTNYYCVVTGDNMNLITNPSYDKLLTISTGLISPTNNFEIVKFNDSSKIKLSSNTTIQPQQVTSMQKYCFAEIDGGEQNPNGDLLIYISNLNNTSSYAIYRLIVNVGTTDLTAIKLIGSDYTITSVVDGKKIKLYIDGGAYYPYVALLSCVVFRGNIEFFISEITNK